VLSAEQVANRGRSGPAERECAPGRRVHECPDPAIAAALPLEAGGELGHVGSECPQSEHAEREIGRVVDRGLPEVVAGRTARVSPGRVQAEHRPRRQRRIGPPARLGETAVRLLPSRQVVRGRGDQRRGGGKRRQLQAHATSTRSRRP
jgi:hypothetical protein